MKTTAPSSLETFYSRAKRKIFSFCQSLLILSAKVSLNLIYYTTVTNLGYCATTFLFIYGGVGLFNPEEVLPSQLWALTLSFNIFSDALTACFVLSTPISREFLKQRLGEEYILKCVGGSGIYPLLRILGILISLFAIEFGASMAHWLIQYIGGEEIHKTFSILLDQDPRQVLKEDSISESMEEWAESTAHTRRIKAQMITNLMTICHQFKTPLPILVDLIKKVAFGES